VQGGQRPSLTSHQETGSQMLEATMKLTHTTLAGVHLYNLNSLFTGLQVIFQLSDAYQRDNLYCSEGKQISLPGGVWVHGAAHGPWCHVSRHSNVTKHTANDSVMTLSRRAVSYTRHIWEKPGREPPPGRRVGHRGHPEEKRVQSNIA
jgi:hypothetical protein